MDFKDLKIRPEQKGTLRYSDARMFVRGWIVPGLSRRRRQRRLTMEQWGTVVLCGLVSALASLLTYYFQ